MRCRVVQTLCRSWRADVYVPGNLLIQPNFAWHDHTNNSNEPIIRIDALDSGLVNYLLTASFVKNRLNTTTTLNLVGWHITPLVVHWPWPRSTTDEVFLRFRRFLHQRILLAEALPIRHDLFAAVFDFLGNDSLGLA